MKYRFSYIAIIAAAIAWVSVSHAESNMDGKHYTSSEWSFFSGGGFTSGLEGYARQDNEAGQVTLSAQPGNTPTGHTSTPSEYLFFAGKGFTSGLN